MDKKVDDIDTQVMTLLGDYDCPGNVRDLENLIERSVALSSGNAITARELPPALSTHAISVVRAPDNGLPTLEERDADYTLGVGAH